MATGELRLGILALALAAIVFLGAFGYVIAIGTMRTGETTVGRGPVFDQFSTLPTSTSVPARPGR